jgi:hypothetical protein
MSGDRVLGYFICLASGTRLGSVFPAAANDFGASGRARGGLGLGEVCAWEEEEVRGGDRGRGGGLCPRA